MNLTIEDIERGYTDDRWEGWGYLGGRKYLADNERDVADGPVLSYANDHGWDYEALFTWMNSRPGRHFADWSTHPRAAECLVAVSL